MKNDLRIPHFLRVTQALAFVSGFGLPLSTGCGGSTSTSTTYDGAAMGKQVDDAAYADDSPVGQPYPGGGGVSVPYDGSASGSYDSGEISPYDGAVTGVVVDPDASMAYDGGPTGVVIYDGGPTGVVIYDGGPTGVVIYDGGPVGIIPFDGGHLVGGPLSPPDLPV